MFLFKNHSLISIICACYSIGCVLTGADQDHKHQTNDDNDNVSFVLCLVDLQTDKLQF